MKIRTRLTILFTVITAVILLLFASVIYYSAKENREKEFYSLLKKEAYTKANLFFAAKVDKKTLQDIYHNNRKILNEVEVAIYDTGFHLLYHDAVDIDFVKETKPMIDEIERSEEITFYQKDWQVIGLRYRFDNQDYILTAAAYDQYGYSKLSNLLTTIIVVFIISILLICVAGIFFSKKAFAPVKRMVENARNISTTNLDLRLPSIGSKDELSELANTFNQMLDRLEKSFDAQKNFVSNISHELRTPLTAMLAELQLTAEKERTNEEYKKAVEHVISDTQKLIRLSNSLLDLAKANYDQVEITFKVLRLDEVLLDARNEALHNHHDFKIDISFEQEFENEDQILVKGNEYLLKVAFCNLFENGCKFSDNRTCTASISFTDKSILIRFKDTGIGIAEEDLQHIFTPFYRGENEKHSCGNGIGLSLTEKIILLHNGKISVSSKQNQGTTFIVELEHL